MKEQANIHRRWLNRRVQGGLSKTKQEIIAHSAMGEKEGQRQ